MLSTGELLFWCFIKFSSDFSWKPMILDGFRETLFWNLHRLRESSYFHHPTQSSYRATSTSTSTHLFPSSHRKIPLIHRSSIWDTREKMKEDLQEPTPCYFWSWLIHILLPAVSPLLWSQEEISSKLHFQIPLCSAFVYIPDSMSKSIPILSFLQNPE